MLMSKSEYAKHKGVSRQTVYDWIKKGDLVMSGKKIDVTATEGKDEPENGARAEFEISDDDNERNLEMTWPQAWEAVKAMDGKVTEPTSYHEAVDRINAACEELGWSAYFHTNGGITLDDGESVCVIKQHNWLEDAEKAIGVLRRDFCYIAGEQAILSPDDVQDWSRAGILALAFWTNF